jgi:multidrug efflux system membrane fusion protein
MTRRALWLIVAVPLAAGAAVAWYLNREPATAQTSASQTTAPAQPTGVPVTAGLAQRQDVAIFLNGLGTVQAFNTVTLKARVDGQLDKVLYTEGQDVKEGDVLVQIDPRPFQAQLAQALAAKAKDEALLANAQLDLQRFSNLATREFASRQSVDTQRALVAQYQAALQGDQATIDNARVQLGYATITAPITGRTGMRLVDKGNIVHANDTNGLVVLTQLQPISVVFTLPQDMLDEITREMARGQLKVLAYKRDDTSKLGEGTLSLIDNQIDAATGSIRLKATFANADNALWPGQFVNARLMLKVQKDAITVPAQVVQRGPKGTFAYVIKQDDTVELRPVKLGQTREGTAIIEEGLAAGERVVVDGQYKLRAGTRIQAAPDSEKPKPQTASNAS